MRGVKGHLLGLGEEVVRIAIQGEPADVANDVALSQTCATAPPAGVAFSCQVRSER
jgi:hypothetical protein